MISSWRRETARALFLWSISGAAALALPASLEVSSPSARLLEVAPGRIVTASMVIVNRGAEADDFSERLTLPAGCQKVAPPDAPFRLEAGGQIIRVLAVLVPPGMPAGRFEMRYAVQSRSNPSSGGQVDLALQVTPVDKLELVVEPRPDVVIAGDVYPVKLRVTNVGNSRLAVQIAQRSSLAFPIDMDAGAFTLEAGASREIACRVKTDPTFAQHTRHAVTFDVTALSMTGKTLTASQASVVEIIPRVSGSTDPFHHLPMELRLMTVAESGHAAQFQAELSGAGSLDEAGRQQVDFIFRGPDVKDATLFGERDEYGASYHDEDWDIDLGDRVYSLSPLTEKGSMGRGAGVTWHGDQVTAGGFYMSTRFRQQNTEELGAFVRRDLTPNFSLQGSFLRKTGGDLLSAKVLPQDLMTIESHYVYQKMLDLHLEAGISLSDSGGRDFAYRADARGELPGKLTYALEQVHAGPGFLGYYSSTDTTTASVTKVLTPRFQAHATLVRYEDNPALNDVLSSVVNRENSWNAGVDFALTKWTDLSLEWRHVQRTDILQPAAYDFTSEALHLGAGHNFGRIQVQSYLELGTLDDSLAGQSGAFQRYNLSAQWQPTPTQTYSVFASYGPSASTGSTEKELGAGISAHWQVRDHLEVNLSCAHNQFDGLTGQEQDQVLGSIQYQFANKNSISVLGRWAREATKGSGPSGTQPLNDSAILVTYTIPLSAPVSRKRSIGTLEGRLSDASKGPGKGLARVVLQVGEQFAVTDEAGLFEFPSLKPGAGELSVVADSLGPHLTMSTPMPMKIRIRPGETCRVELAAASACVLSVHVLRYEFTEGNALSASGTIRAAGGQEGIAVEISHGKEVWRAQTDRTGTASFDRLPGGAWSLRLAGGDLPTFHTLENPAQTLALQPGESREISLRVLPQRRTLRLLDHGSIH